jgi:hypothetical protein
MVTVATKRPIARKRASHPIRTVAPNLLSRRVSRRVATAARQPASRHPEAGAGDRTADLVGDADEVERERTSRA